tara:strand:+ start:97 stop:711 length:615 start_codon:yes stop_codon:yes gene_type:complete
MQSYSLDVQGHTQLLKNGEEYQVMMQWEKPWMEACVDHLKPQKTDDILEIGFGLGYSATQFQKYHPRTHTIVECDDTVLEKLREWAQDKPNVIIKKGFWQNVLPSLGKFDAIFMDDFPLDAGGNTSQMLQQSFRGKIFIEMCAESHLKPGARLSTFATRSMKHLISHPKLSITEHFIKVLVPPNCTYMPSGENIVNIPLIKYLG